MSTTTQIQTFYEGEEFSYAEKIDALKIETRRLELEEIAALTAKATAVAESYAKEVAALSAKAAEVAEEFAKMISALSAKMTLSSLPTDEKPKKKSSYLPVSRMTSEEYEHYQMLCAKKNANKKARKAAEKAASASASASASSSASASPMTSPKPKRTITPEHLAALRAGAAKYREVKKAAASPASAASASAASAATAPIVLVAE